MVETDTMPRAEQVARQVREFAAGVENPDNWMIIIPIDIHADVEEQLDTTKDVGRYYEGISFCWSDRHDEPTVEYRAGLTEHLEEQ